MSYGSRFSVFLDDSTAHKFLGRKLLYNYWDFELIVPDNLERECIEEICSYEEAREVFEDDKKTAEYGDWVECVIGASRDFK